MTSAVQVSGGQPMTWDYLRSQEAQKDLEMAVIVLEAALDAAGRERKAGRPLYSSIVSRVKSEESILAKIGRKEYAALPDPLARLNDLLGVRIICSFLDDVYAAATVLAAMPQVDVVRVKDYIAHPKESGYRGIHLNFWLTLPCGRRLRMEAQLRTTAMNFWSELDYQLCYKRTGGQGLRRVAGQLRRQAAVIASMDEEMIRLRQEIEVL